MQERQVDSFGVQSTTLNVSRSDLSMPESCRVGGRCQDVIVIVISSVRLRTL